MAACCSVVVVGVAMAAVALFGLFTLPPNDCEMSYMFPRCAASAGNHMPVGCRVSAFRADD